MRSTLLGLTVPVLMIAAAFAATVVPQAAAQATTYTISGRVLSDEGLPLEGARVSAWTYFDDPSRSSTAGNDEDITDADGRYELTLTAGRGSINVYYEKWRQSDYREFSLDADQTIDFTLKTPPPKTAKIVGVVVDAAGNPIAGAEVQLQYACCYAYPEPMPVDAQPTTATTEPAVEPASDANATTTEGGSGSSGSSDGATSPAYYGEGDVAIARPFMPPYYDDWQTFTTEADGRFSFDGYAGPRQITALAKGYAQTTQQVEAKENETVEVRIVLEKAPERSAVVEGRVVDSKTGVPVPGADVNVRSLEWGRYAYARADADGRFRIETVPGWSEISVSYYRAYEETLVAEKIAAPRALEAQYYPYTTLVKLQDGSNDLDPKLDAKPKPTVVLTGYVVDPDAKAGVEGARVNVWNHETGDWGEAVTDATGSYKVLVREGHYSISAWKEGYLGGTQTFSVDSAAERIDVVLPKGTTRYAPCWDEEDCGGYGPIMYADGAEVRAKEAGATGVAASPPQTPVAESDEGANFASGFDSSRAATYEGGGGGLPPYDPNAAAATTEPGTQTEPIPGLGLLAGLAVLGLAALALRRRQ